MAKKLKLSSLNKKYSKGGESSKKENEWGKQDEWFGNPSLGYESYKKLFKGPNGKMIPVFVFGTPENGWNYVVHAGKDSDYSYTGNFPVDVRNGSAEQAMKHVDERFRVGQLFFAKGGQIKNQYEGKTVSEVWKVWSKSQRHHFLRDHFHDMKMSEVSELCKKEKATDLPEPVQAALSFHALEGQYAEGGSTRKITAKDEGVWVDGNRGIYVGKEVIDIAKGYGFIVKDEDKVNATPDGEHYDELTDEATEYLNTLAPEGYYFDFHEGDYGLWKESEDEFKKGGQPKSKKRKSSNKRKYAKGGRPREVMVYKFEELDEDAQQKALEGLWDINVDHDWWEFTYEDAANVGLVIEEFDLDRDLDRGSYVKADFKGTAKSTADKIIKEHGKGTETYKDAESYNEDYAKLMDKYEKLAKEEEKESGEYEFDDYNFDKEVEEISEEFLKTLQEDYRIILQKDYDYRTSKEAIIETIDANEYEFLEDGRLSSFKKGGRVKYAEGGTADKEYNFDDWSKYDDEDLAHDIDLFAENDSDLYRQRYVPIMKNQKKKLDKGKFDVILSAKLWKYYIEDADKRYQKQVMDRTPKGFALSVNDRKLLAERMAEFTKLEYGANKLEGFARGGSVNDDDLLERANEYAGEKIQELVDDTSGFGYENYYGVEVMDVGHTPMSGFIPFTNGGKEISWFENVEFLHSKGQGLPTKKLEGIMESSVNQSHEYAKEWFIKNHPDIAKELGDDKINYRDLEEAGYIDEAEELDDAERENMNESIMFEVHAYFYHPSNHHGKDHKPTCSLTGLVNMEAPYHRPGKFEDFKEVTFNFESEQEFKEKFDKAIIEVKNWFEKSDYKGKQENKIEFARGGQQGVERVANSESHVYSENKIPFKGNNLEGKTLDNGDYVVLSYGHYPIWYYCSKENKWYGNKDKYSVTTSKQTSQSRPDWNATQVSHQELLNIMKQDSESRYDLGGIMIRDQMPMSIDNTAGAHGGSAVLAQAIT